MKLSKITGTKSNKKISAYTETFVIHLVTLLKHFWKKLSMKCCNCSWRNRVFVFYFLFSFLCLFSTGILSSATMTSHFSLPRHTLDPLKRRKKSRFPSIEKTCFPAEIITMLQSRILRITNNSCSLGCCNLLLVNYSSFLFPLVLVLDRFELDIWSVYFVLAHIRYA